MDQLQFLLDKVIRLGEALATTSARLDGVADSVGEHSEKITELEKIEGRVKAIEDRIKDSREAHKIRRQNLIAITSLVVSAVFAALTIYFQFFYHAPVTH